MMHFVGLLHQQFEVVPVHGDNVRESLEVFLRDAAGLQVADRDPATLGRRLRTMIRWIANVIGMGARRVDFEQVLESGFPNVVSKHTFRGR